MPNINQRVEVDFQRTPRSKQEIKRTKAELEDIQQESRQAVALATRARRSRRQLATAVAAASSGRASGTAASGGAFGVTGEGFKIFGLAKFSSTGLTLEGGELISKLGGRFLMAAAVGRSIEGVSRGAVNIRDRLALGQDFGSATGQAGLDTVRSISRGLASAVGLEGTARNMIALLTGKSQEQASKVIEDFWDLFTLDSTKEFERKQKIAEYREVQGEKISKGVERLRQDHITSRADFLATMGVPMSQRFGHQDFNNFVERRRRDERKRLDRVLEDSIKQEFYAG